MRPLLLILALLSLSGCGTTSTSCSLAYFMPSATAGKEVGIGYANLASGTSVAQAFVATQAKAPVTAFVRLKRVGSFTTASHTLTATIETTTTNGSGTNIPSSLVLATSRTLDPSTISNSSASSYAFSFSGASALSLSTIYWLKIRASYPTSDTNYVLWEAWDGATGGYFDSDANRTPLNAVYHNGTTFVNDLIGTYRFLTFSVGC